MFVWFIRPNWHKVFAQFVRMFVCLFSYCIYQYIDRKKRSKEINEEMANDMTKKRIRDRIMYDEERMSYEDGDSQRACFQK